LGLAVLEQEPGDEREKAGFVSLITFRAKLCSNLSFISPIATSENVRVAFPLKIKSSQEVSKPQSFIIK
jgi:hypothetical protein